MNSWQRALRGARHDWQIQAVGVLNTALGFVCLAGTLLLMSNLLNLSLRWSGDARATVYLVPSALPTDVEALTSALRATPSVAQAVVVSSEQSRKELMTLGTPLLDDFPEEAFPQSIEVRLHAADTAESKLLTERLRLLPAVESVELYVAWSEGLRELITAALVAGAVLAATLAVAATSVIAATVRMSLQRRHAEVEILEIVGATRAYIRRPFLIEGGAQGAVGALLALGLLGAAFSFIQRHYDQELSILLGGAPEFLPWSAGIGLVGMGTLLGMGSALLGVRRLMS